jgi:hypothetical protein
MWLVVVMGGVVLAFVGAALLSTSRSGTARPETGLAVTLALLVAALVPLVPMFLWALAVFDCHGGYECPF